MVPPYVGFPQHERWAWREDVLTLLNWKLSSLSLTISLLPHFIGQYKLNTVQIEEKGKWFYLLMGGATKNLQLSLIYCCNEWFSILLTPMKTIQSLFYVTSQFLTYSLCSTSMTMHSSSFLAPSRADER